jgi:two-component system CheB/CheR fusion protein
VDDLFRTSNDLKNLLNSTDIATLFLDNALRVRRFSSQTTKITQLIDSDVGRPITDIASDLFYPELGEDVRQVLRKLGSAEKQVATRDGRWFNARILPYHTLENMIDGVVITFVNITVSKTLEAKLRNMQADLEKHIVAQDVKLDQAGERLQAEMQREKGTGTIPGSGETAEISHE